MVAGAATVGQPATTSVIQNAYRDLKLVLTAKCRDLDMGSIELKPQCAARQAALQEYIEGSTQAVTPHQHI
jgi:hypothetical protein